MSVIAKPSLGTGGWDRTFLYLSSRMSEPLCSAWHLLRFRLIAPLDPQKFENYSSLPKEIALRILISMTAAFGAFLIGTTPIPMILSMAGLGLGSKLLRAIGFALQKGGFTHIRGKALEKSLDPRDPQPKVVTWNVAGIGGGLSLDHAGVVHWRSRLDAIVKKLKAEDADVLVLQEIYDTDLMEALVDRLKSDYAHFFTHLGPNVWGSVGGCMVLSKCAVHHFSYTPFKNNHWTLNRGFASLELKARAQDTTPCARIIGTHLIHGEEPSDQKKRAVQVAQIADYVARQTLNIPTVLAGDLNIERDQKEGSVLSPHLGHGYTGRAPTCTNRLVAQWDAKKRSVWGETIDYISLFKSTLPFHIPLIGRRVALKNCRLIRAFDETYNTKTALSDHHGIAAVIKGLHV